MAQQQRFKAPKGTQDFLADQTPRWQAIERIAREVAAVYHFQEIGRR